MKFSRRRLVQEIMREGRVLRLHSGATEIVAERAASEVAEWAKVNTECTQHELNKRVARELKKYNRDLAYLYQNRGKII